MPNTLYNADYPEPDTGSKQKERPNKYCLDTAPKIQRTIHNMQYQHTIRNIKPTKYNTHHTINT